MVRPLTAAAAVAAVAAASLAVAVPASGAVLATTSSATVVGAVDGWTAWSERRDGRFALVVRAPDGTVAAAPVATRGVPFDLDLGRDRAGAPVAAYSRCGVEPRPTGGANTIGPQWTSGRGCSVRILELRTGRERSVRRRSADASEVLPSVSGGRLASVVVPEGRRGRRTARLLVRDLGSRRRSVLDSGPRRAASSGFAEGPTSVDLDGRRVASVWRLRNAEFGSFDSDLRVQRLDARRPRHPGGASNSESCDYATVLAPTLRGGRVAFLFTTGAAWALNSTASRGGAATTFGARELAPDGGPVPTSAALDGVRLVVADTATEIGGGAAGATRILELPAGPFDRADPVTCEG